MTPGMKSKLLLDLQYVEINLNNAKSGLQHDAFQLAIVVEQLSDVVKAILENWHE